MKPRVPHDCWFLACDGGCALDMRNAGDAELLNFIAMDSIVNLDHRRECSEAIVRAGSTGRSALREARLSRLTGTNRPKSDLSPTLQANCRLSHATKASKISCLLRPRRVLGQLRKQLGPRAWSVVSAELAKDLVKFEVSDIEKYLSG